MTHTVQYTPKWTFCHCLQYVCMRAPCNYWANEASPTWGIHLGFFIYILLSYVRRGLCDPLFFFLWRALCAVQSSCTVLFRCARPTHALHASSCTVVFKVSGCVQKSPYSKRSEAKPKLGTCMWYSNSRGIGLQKRW